MNKTFDVKEMVEKEVVSFGNGSIVYTPKKWIGEKVKVLLEEKPLNVEEETMRALNPFLPHIQGVYLFGSHARAEQTEQSDIDVLIITDKNITPKKEDKFDFLIKTKNDFAREITKDPSLYLYQAINEAKPILNESLLAELKKIPIKPDFTKFLENTLEAFKKTKILLGTYKNKEYLESNTIIYSLILRLRGLYIIQCFKKNKAFSNNDLKELLIKKGFNEKEANDLMETYKTERDDRKTKTKISVANAEKLFEVTKKEFIKTEELI